MRATLRDARVDLKNVSMTYTRYQDAVPFFVENSLTHAGATAAAIKVADLQADGSPEALSADRVSERGNSAWFKSIRTDKSLSGSASQV